MLHARRITSVAVLAAITGACWSASATPSAAAVEALIKQQSQEFSDASASGDAKVLERYLDDRVIFINEGGDMPSKKDIVGSAGPSPAGVSSKLVQTDWGFQLHGPVAVTSFTDVLTQEFHGQAVQASFRSTEVWFNEQGKWRMISSQTVALQDDPAAVALPSKAMDEYVGTYQAGPDLSYRIIRDGDSLSGAIGDGKPREMKAEVLDVLFTPGVPRYRKIFQRDATGKVTGFVSRHEGHDVVFQRVG